MILLDTHLWVWWILGDARLSGEHAQCIDRHRGDGVGVSVISCWEVAKLIQLGRLSLPAPLDVWISMALRPTGVTLISLTSEIAIESTRLPRPFHHDPADGFLVAMARVLNCPLLTVDHHILQYPFVNTACPPAHVR